MPRMVEEGFSKSRSLKHEREFLAVAVVQVPLVAVVRRPIPPVAVDRAKSKCPLLLVDRVRVDRANSRWVRHRSLCRRVFSVSYKGGGGKKGGRRREERKGVKDKRK